MRKTLLTIILLFFLSGCSNISNNNRLDEDDMMKDVYITEIEWCNIEWEQIQFPIDMNEIDVLEDIKPIETNQVAIDGNEGVLIKAWVEE